MANLYSAVAVTSPQPEGFVLLVDDIVDSRWTLTVVGFGLCDAGTRSVHPRVRALDAGDR